MTIQGIARDQLVHSIWDTVRKITESRGKKMKICTSTKIDLNLAGVRLPMRLSI